MGSFKSKLFKKSEEEDRLKLIPNSPLFPTPEEEDIAFENNKLRFDGLIGREGCAILVRVISNSTSDQYVLKVECSSTSAAEIESEMYSKLYGAKGVPVFYTNWIENGCTVLQIDNYGVKLTDFIELKGGLSRVEVYKLAPQMIAILEEVHKKGVIHGDVKTSNFVFGMGHNAGELQLIGFNHAENAITHDEGFCDKFKRIPRGTGYYLSANLHRYCHGSPRDDLESLVYCLLEMLGIQLPWTMMREPQSFVDHQMMFQMKMGNTSGAGLCEFVPIQEMLGMCRALTCQEKPNYDEVKQLFSCPYVRAMREV
ncbi:hypothetical protein GCK72_025831 [Caenorhabditis remanei]|nr:hypothetical protein GCK72_025831 [Caenorhabditis remanei]KAF1749363.1 hypothetical protein GCK72_025831 [Caenorhabditis remanei]